MLLNMKFCDIISVIKPDVRLEQLYLMLGGFFLSLWIFKSIEHFQRNRNGLPLPPGPQGLPLIGNLLDMPIEKQWEVYHDWSKKYGDIISFEIFGQRFIVLGSLNGCFDLFERRSSIYSSRPRMPMLMELMRWDYIMSFLPYGDIWRRHRRMFNDHFHPNIIHKYTSVQTARARQLLVRLRISPQDFHYHTRHVFASMIMKIAYGIDISDENDPYVAMAEEALSGLAAAGIPGRFLVDLAPILKYLSSWMPGAGFKKLAKHWRAVNNDVEKIPWNLVRDNLRLGKATPSLSSALMERLPDEDHPLREQEEKAARGVAAVAYIGGADTTVSAGRTFFLAMAMNPGVQRKAHEEIDRVIGSHRLPEFSDRTSLPYINAIVKETMRWQNVTPLGVGHMVTDDDVYSGYFIPKGSILLGNIWSILHDPEVYPAPHQYKPERFLKHNGELDPSVQDPTVAAFGFGRRICPGRFLSNNSLFIFIASILAVYEIKAPLDAQGNPIKLVPNMTSGMISGPTPFDCVIEPRSKAADALIEQLRDAD